MCRDGTAPLPVGTAGADGAYCGDEFAPEAERLAFAKPVCRPAAEKPAYAIPSKKIKESFKIKSNVRELNFCYNFLNKTQFFKSFFLAIYKVVRRTVGISHLS